MTDATEDKIIELLRQKKQGLSANEIGVLLSINDYMETYGIAGILSELERTFKAKRNGVDDENILEKGHLCIRYTLHSYTEAEQREITKKRNDEFREAFSRFDGDSF